MSAARTFTGRADIPRIGQLWPEQGGIYLGIVRGAKDEPDYHLIRAEAEPAKRLTWQQAKKWAAGLTDGGHTDWQLPSRGHEGWLCADGETFDWFWLAEKGDGSFAWNQYFDNGYQFNGHKSYEGRAVAVRRLVLQSFDSSEAA
jgi:hypothetical protein